MKKKIVNKPPELLQQLESGKLQRRHIRYKLFQIRINKKEIDLDLKQFIENQFNKNHNWSNFTFEWDVGVDDPLKVICIEDWVASGGVFDSMGKRIPPAFTQQK